MNTPLLERLRYHVTGAIERGEAVPIACITASDRMPDSVSDGPHENPSEDWNEFDYDSLDDDDAELIDALNDIASTNLALLFDAETTARG